MALGGRELGLFDAISRRDILNAAKLNLMGTLTYADFRKDYVKADPQLQAYFRQSTAEYFGCGIDAVTDADACGNGNPGFDAMGLGGLPSKTMSPSGRLALTDPDDYIFHFPDGDGSIARPVVRSLITQAIPGHTMEDIVLATSDYGKQIGLAVCVNQAVRLSEMS